SAADRGGAPGAIPRMARRPVRPYVWDPRSLFQRAATRGRGDVLAGLTRRPASWTARRPRAPRLLSQGEFLPQRLQRVDDPGVGELGLSGHRRPDEALAPPFVGLLLHLEARVIPHRAGEHVDVLAGEKAPRGSRRRENR